MNKKQLILNNIERDFKESKYHKLISLFILDRHSYRLYNTKCKMLIHEYYLVDKMYDIPKEDMNYGDLMFYNKLMTPRLKELEKDNTNIAYDVYIKTIILRSYAKCMYNMATKANLKNIDKFNYIKTILYIKFINSIDKYDITYKNISKINFLFNTHGTSGIYLFMNNVKSGKLKFGQDF